MLGQIHSWEEFYRLYGMIVPPECQKPENELIEQVLMQAKEIACGECLMFFVETEKDGKGEAFVAQFLVERAAKSGYPVLFYLGVD